MDTQTAATKKRSLGQAIWANTDNLTKWIQVIALVFAAIWTFFTFRATEAPSLRTPAGVGASLTVSWHGNPQPPYCWVQASFSISDDGANSLEVGSTRVRVWRFPIGSQTQGNTMVDFAKLESSTSPIADFRPDTVLNGHYGPKTKVHATFPWIFYGAPSSDLLFTQIDVLDKSNRPLGTASAWNNGICG